MEPPAGGRDMESEKHVGALLAGTVIHLRGLPFRLLSNVDISGTFENYCIAMELESSSLEAKEPIPHAPPARE